MDEERPKMRSRIFLIVGILLVAANLRAPITTLSPLLSYIRVDLPLSNTMTGFLTTLPLLAFAGLSPFVSKLARRWGMEFIVFFCIMFNGSGEFDSSVWWDFIAFIWNVSYWTSNRSWQCFVTKPHQKGISF